MHTIFCCCQMQEDTSGCFNILNRNHRLSKSVQLFSEPEPATEWRWEILMRLLSQCQTCASSGHRIYFASQFVTKRYSSDSDCNFSSECAVCFALSQQREDKKRKRLHEMEHAQTTALSASPVIMPQPPPPTTPSSAAGSSVFLPVPHVLQVPQVVPPSSGVVVPQAPASFAHPPPPDLLPQTSASSLLPPPPLALGGGGGVSFSSQPQPAPVQLVLVPQSQPIAGVVSGAAAPHRRARNPSSDFDRNIFKAFKAVVISMAANKNLSTSNRFPRSLDGAMITVQVRDSRELAIVCEHCLSPVNADEVCVCAGII